MAARGSGTILLTGASASVKGYAQSAPFAMGKFGLRGLAQSLAREFQPQGLHIAHFVIDGGIRSAARPDDGGDALLDPDAITETYYQVARQHRPDWSWEVELSPWQEPFYPRASMLPVFRAVTPASDATPPQHRLPSPGRVSRP